MTATVFTPKQVAQALGVSESSVKRWVDNGKLRAAKTAGGHRKVPLPSLVHFIRETGHEVVEPALVGMAGTGSPGSLAASCDRLFDDLVAGKEAPCRELVLSYYQSGESIQAIGDELIGPVFTRIGDAWAEGTVQVHQERRACEIAMAVLHELRRWLPAPADDAPLAVVATPSQDFAEVPARLVELVLVSLGWQSVVLGSGLPLEEIRGAIGRHQPRLVCLSAVHLENADAFVANCNSELIEPLREAENDATPEIVVGGRAFDCTDVTRLECDLFAKDLATLVSHLEKLPETA
ncbi:MAG: helix-turn-helix domain-containing protein [Planctomycetota bacterium]